MKPILFAKDETDFTTNGLGRLDCISCNVIEERNGIFELEAEIPITGAHAREIEQQSIIGAKTHDGGNIQAFSVYKITKPISGRFMVYARHISYRLSDIPCSPFSIAASPQAAANTLAGLKSHALEPCPFNFSTDVTTGNSYNQTIPASIRQRLGGIEGSVIDQFGGEYEFDNWDVKLWKSRGRLANTTGISLRYGKNITDIEQEEEIATTVTGVVPFWIDTDGNNLVTLPEYVVYADNADQYPYHITQVLDLSGSFQDKPTVAQLRGVANTYVHKDGFGVPKVSIKVSFRNLWESEEYKDVAPLERVQLCDEISVYFEKLGISAIAKVVKTDYDVLKERYNNVEVGSLRTTLAQAVTDRDQDIDSAFINELTRVSGAISNATAWLTSANGYVVAVKNTDGSWKELLLMNTNNPQTATQGIRFNNNGIGFFNKAQHPDGNIMTGPYDMAWTMDGRLGDFANKNFWNFFTGDFSLNANTTVGGKTVQQIADEAKAGAEATAAQNLATAVTRINGDIDNLQDQIDGNITTWYYDYVPTLNNLPASDWDTPEERNNHIGDLFYQVSTGYAYRFMLDNSVTPNVYKWVQISDEDIAEALRIAQGAQDTADHKRRVFVNTPVPPYDIGDLWVQGANGDILRCQTAKTSTETYSASDWIPASKYTDDTYVQNWIATTYAGDKDNIIKQLDGKAETWYQDADPSINWSSESGDGITIKLNANCRTESSYDFFYIYWKEATGDKYSYIRRDGTFGSQEINIPAHEFWVYWHTDASQHDYYGWKIDSVDYYRGNNYTAPSGTGATLPQYTPTDRVLLQLESEHNPYSDNLDVLYHTNTKTSHKGDLWYRTTDNTTWYYDGTGWIEQDIPDAVFDEIDGKAQIFVTTPTVPYHVGDMWVVNDPNNAYDGEILTCMQTEYTTYNPNHWEKKNKYTDDSAVTNMSQYDVWRKLTGNSQDCITLNNGVLGIKATAIATGLLASRENAQTPAFSLNMDTGALVMYSGTFRGLVAAATVQGSTIQGGSININNLFAVDSNGYMTANSGKISDINIASGELYKLGTYVLFSNKRYRTANTTTTKRYNIRTFYPSKLDIKDSTFQITLTYTIESTISRTMYLDLEHYSGSSWSEQTYIRLDSTAGTHTATLNYTFSNTDSSKWRIQLEIYDGTDRVYIWVTAEILNIRVLSLGTGGIWGTHRGSFIGTGNFNSLTAGADDINTTIDDSGIMINDYNYSYYAEITSRRLYLYVNDNRYSKLDNSELIVKSSSDSYCEVKPTRLTLHSSDNYNMYLDYDGEYYVYRNGTSYSGMIYNGSDRRIKEDITDLSVELAIAIIDNTQTHRFKYKNRYGYHYGVIAQEARELLDNVGEEDAELVYDCGNPTITDQINVNYDEYAPLLINYVKDLRAQNNRQQAEIDELKAEINELKEIVKKLSV